MKPWIIGADATDILLDAADSLETGDEYVMGGFWGRLKKKIKKKIRKVVRKLPLPWKQIDKIARVVGPVVAAVIPGAAPAIAAASFLTKSASKGNLKALATIRSIQKAAAAGIPGAVEAQNVFAVAKNISKQKAAAKVVVAIQAGNVDVRKRVKSLMLRESVSPRAARTTSAIRAVLVGQTPQYQARLRVAIAKARAPKKVTPSDVTRECERVCRKETRKAAWGRL